MCEYNMIDVAWTVMELSLHL